MKNWKTTVYGVCCVLAALAGAGKALFDGDPSTSVDVVAVATAVAAGFGLIVAKDAAQPPPQV